MRKKMILAAAVLGMTLTVSACSGSSAAGSAQEENRTEGEETAGSGEASGEEKKTEPAEAQEPAGASRLVSVEDTGKYLTLGQYKGLELERTVQEITDEDVELRIQTEMENHREEVTASDGAVEMGDQVTINYVGTIDGETFDGGTANNFDLVVGDGGFIDGFEDGIVGMKKGETRDLPLTFPENYVSTLAGKDVNFQITLQAFRRAPEFSEEWVKKNTDYETEEEYRASIRTQLEEEAKETAETSLTSNAWNMVWTSSEVIEYPQKDIDNFINQYKKINELYAAQAGMSLEELIEAQGYTQENFDKDCQQYAEYVVKQNLIVQAIMDAEGISLDDPECLEIQNRMMEQYGATDLADLIDTYGQESVDQSIGLIRVENFIMENAVITDMVANGDMVGVDENGVTGDEADNGTPETDAGNGAAEAGDGTAEENIAEDDGEEPGAAENAAGETAAEDGGTETE